MFTTFDKAIAGGAAAWISSGVIALVETVFHLPTLDASVANTISMVIGAVLVYFTSNKPAATATK